MTGKQFRDDDEAVSPVIGVILMVAITVILAAVIGTFVLNLGSSVQTNVQAGATIDADNTNDKISVTWTANQNAEYLNVTLTNNSASPSASDDVGLCGVGGKVTWGTSGATTSGNTGPAGCGSGTASTSISSGDGASYSVTVTAVKGEQQTVVNSKSINEL